jgi:hypothetical protein
MFFNVSLRGKNGDAILGPVVEGFSLFRNVPPESGGGG